MTLEDEIKELEELKEHVLNNRTCKALDAGIKALNAMYKIIKAEEAYDAVEILNKYISEVEV